MKPPAGPRNPAFAGGSVRVTRSSTGAARGGTAVRGGGIRKRGAGLPTRVDRDGDMVMDPSLAPNGPANKRNPPTGPQRGRRGGTVRPSRTTSAATAEQKVRQHLGAHHADIASRISEQPRKKFTVLAGKRVFKVTGLENSKAASNPDRGEKALLEFLERKATKMGRSIKISRSRLDSDFVLVVVVHQEDAEELVKLNNFVFAGATLAIIEIPEGWPTNQGSTSTKLSQQSMERKTQLQDVLRQRYDPSAKLLNLAALGEDPILIGMGYLDDKELAQKTFKVLMAICDDTFPTPAAKRDAVLSITLANNNIDNVAQVFEAGSTFPDLKNLDLSGNQFANINKLNRWRGRFPLLETLLMTGNPLEADQAAMKELVDWFPKLVNLSGVRVRTPEQIAAAEAAKAALRPSPLPQNGADFRDTSGIGETFLTQFFTNYDTNRPALVSQFYDNETRFSLSVTTHTPREHGSDPVLPWTGYIKFSRNLTKITNTSTRVQRLIKGAGMIKELWSSLPATKHPDLKTEIHKYIVDCHPLPGLQDPAGQSSNGVDGLLISVHGEFDEMDTTGKTGKRSFTRIFVLGPAPPATGLPYRVISDMLSLRAYNPTPQQSPQPAIQQDPKQLMIAELSRRTNMTAQYSELCLTQVGWNLENAIAKFNETRPNLGPEAFINAGNNTA